MDVICVTCLGDLDGTAVFKKRQWPDRADQAFPSPRHISGTTEISPGCLASFKTLLTAFIGCHPDMRGGSATHSDTEADYSSEVGLCPASDKGCTRTRPGAHFNCDKLMVGWELTCHFLP